MNIKVTPQAPTGWDEFVASHPKGKIYHLSQWNNIVTDTFGHKVFYITLYENDNIVGVLPVTDFKSMLFGHLAVSQPYVNYGGPLLTNSSHLPALMTFLDDFRRQNAFKSIELRMDSPLEIDNPCKQHKVTFFLELPDDEEELFRRFTSKLRSQIRRPTKDEMYHKSGGVELLEDFYHVFCVNMRDLGTPPLPKAFFKRILTTFPENAHIVVVYSKEGIAAAASFLIHYNQIMEIPWASSIREFNRSSPNMLLYWESMKLAIANKCKSFDFGRCSRDSGTWRFKKQWGAVEHQLYWYYALPPEEKLPEISPQNGKFETFVKIWQKMPLPFTNTVGPIVIKHIP